jgi:tetratricopeptide (TPR) repeat protein
MSLSFLTGLGSAASAVEDFDLRGRRDEERDEFEPVAAESVETELSTAGAVARYNRLKNGATAHELIECGVELLSLGSETERLAVEAFRRASRIEGAQAAGLFWLGETHAGAGRAREAIGHYEESVSFCESIAALRRLLALQISEGLDDAAQATRLKLEAIERASESSDRPAS